MGLDWEDILACGLDFTLVSFLASASGGRIVTFHLVSFGKRWGKMICFRELRFRSAAWQEFNWISHSCCSREEPRVSPLELGF